MVTERDAALARVAELEREGDELRREVKSWEEESLRLHPIIAQTKQRVAELEGTVELVQKQSEPVYEAAQKLGEYLFRSAGISLAGLSYAETCRAAQRELEKVNARVAELEKRELTELAGQPIENFLQANTIAEKRTGVRCDILESVKRMDGALTAQKLKIQELEKRGAVDVEACAREISELCRNTPLVRTWPNIVNIEAVIRKHTRDVRRITREDAVRLWQRLPNSTWNELTDALRAIGFEVEA